MQQTNQIIEACERALADFDKTRELLEYPEVQADKAYYLSLLYKFNEQNDLAAKLHSIRQALAEQDNLTQAMPTLSDEEKILAVEEISALKVRILTLLDSLAEILGCENVLEEVFCRLLASDGASQHVERLFELVESDLLSHGATLSNLRTDRKKGAVAEISLTATGRNVLARLSVLSGVHKVQNTPAEVALAVTLAPSTVILDEKDVKIDLFHSGGAGGQNINKVETAVRATHIPTGIVVVCQDERSQLKNKRRALANLEKRLTEQNAELEKKRMDADVKSQLKRISSLSFASNGHFVDKVNGLQGPITAQQFSTYVNALLAARNF